MPPYQSCTACVCGEDRQSFETPVARIESIGMFGLLMDPLELRMQIKELAEAMGFVSGLFPFDSLEPQGIHPQHLSRHEEM